MPEKRDPPEPSAEPREREPAPAANSGGAVHRDTLGSLFDELRERAKQVSEHRREEVHQALEKLQHQARSPNPDKQQMTRHAKALEAFAELAPIANRILELLAGIGA
jgi:hypothetical protein